MNQENEKLKSKPKILAFLTNKRTQKYLNRLCIDEWVDVYIDKRKLFLKVNEENLREKSRLDGCYIWTTEIGADEAADQEIYERYKDLKYVEDDFRTFKTNFLDIWPFHSNSASKGHLFINNAAHIIVRELRKAWFDMNITVQEGIKVLSLICQNSIKFSDSVDIKLIPEPSNQAKDL